MADLESASPFVRFICKCIAPLERKFHFRLYFLNINEFYWAIPPRKQLRDQIWDRPSSLPGIQLNESGQLAMLEQFHNRFGVEYNAIPNTATANASEFYLDNTSYQAADAIILYCMIRTHKPRQVIEIGSGNSTLMSAKALLKNASEGNPGELTAIEPYPKPVIKSGFPGLTRLLPNIVQDVPFSEFEKLESGDILFIDSSHVLNIGGDVQYEFLEILPRLKPGVLVHVHDIFMPFEYPKRWVLEGRFWDEQYILQAFLAFNDSFEVLWAGNWMHKTHPDLLAKAMTSYSEKSSSPGAFWIRRTK